MTMKIPGGAHEKIGAAVPAPSGTTVVGGTFTIGVNQTKTVAELSGSSEEGAWTIVSGATACTGTAPSDAIRARHQVMLSISYGTPSGGHVDVVPAGKKVVIVGSSVRVDAFIRRTDGDALVATITSDVSAFISKGAPDAEAYPSQWIEPALIGPEPNLGAVYSGRISAVPCTLKSIFAVNLGTAEGTFVVLDQARFSRPSADADLHNSPILFAVPVPAGKTASFDLPRGRRAFQGLVWGVSSTRTPLSLDTTQLFRVDAEIGYL